VNAPKPAADAALDALAAALAPRVLRLLREQAGADDEGLAELLAASGFELDAEATVEPAPRKRGGR
jgi:hypothetical protein